ncbi:hypothetical protein [Vibrio vulnificus]|uniref:hypothetical protein n=1 Tax=Vibrio vulnificus TaxID=672 RepID=UPI0037DABBA5
MAVTKSKHFLLFSWDKTARIVSQGGAFREACQARDATTHLQHKSIIKIRFENAMKHQKSTAIRAKDLIVTFHQNLQIRCQFTRQTTNL